MFLKEGDLRAGKNSLPEKLLAMLPKKYRLNGKLDFLRVRNKGRVFQGKLFGLAVYKREDQETSRFGFIVSTKISKKAPERNRAKRLLRESIAHVIKEINLGFDCVILAKSLIIGRTLAEVKNEMLGLLTEGGVRTLK